MGPLRRVAFVAALVVAGLATGAAADEFQDCPHCPVMVDLPAGTYTRSLFAEAPQQEVTVGAFAIGKFEVTVAEFAAFLSATGYEVPPGCAIFNVMGARMNPEASWRRPGFQVPETAPALCVTWDDAVAYAEWLSAETGRSYRLPTEAEWDYAAHAGAENNLSYFIRAGLGRQEANCHDCAGFDMMGREDLLFALPVDTFVPNDFGLHVMFGNAAEWIADCHNATYQGAPTDGTAWLQGDCGRRIPRGGGWHTFWNEMAASRPPTDPNTRDNAIGFRVARDLE
jgi:formylglycine-generating enzyme required for sulfatase activity